MRARSPALLSCLLALGCMPRPPPTLRAVEANNLCAQAIDRGDLQVAEDQCDLCIEFSPEFADCWSNKGAIYFQRSQYPKAKEYLITALRKNPDHAQAHNNLGAVYLEERAYGKAHDEFVQALRVNPDYEQARYNLAYVLRLLKKPDEARRQARMLLEVYPDNARGHGMLAELDLQDKKPEEALPHLLKATRLDPGYFDGWYTLGDTFLQLGKPCDAKDAYAACIEVKEQHPGCRNQIIQAQQQCALQEKALEDVKARGGKPRTADGEYAAALRAKEKGLLNDEERAYLKCLKVDDRFAPCHFGLFEVFKGRADEKKARIACQNFLKFASRSELPRQVQDCEQFLGGSQ